MARLIDVNELKQRILAERDKIPIELPSAIYELGARKPNHHGNSMRGGIRKALRCMEQCRTVDAVPVEQYKALIERYNELRENFVDYVCSGVPNVAPYCLNKCKECVDAWGWCKQTDECKGFNPAEVVLDEERRTNA